MRLNPPESSWSHAESQKSNFIENMENCAEAESYKAIMEALEYVELNLDLPGRSLIESIPYIEESEIQQTSLQVRLDKIDVQKLKRRRRGGYLIQIKS